MHAFCFYLTRPYLRIKFRCANRVKQSAKWRFFKHFFLNPIYTYISALWEIPYLLSAHFSLSPSAVYMKHCRIEWRYHARTFEIWLGSPIVFTTALKPNNCWSKPVSSWQRRSSVRRDWTRLRIVPPKLQITSGMLPEMWIVSLMRVSLMCKYAKLCACAKTGARITNFTVRRTVYVATCPIWRDKS